MQRKQQILTQSIQRWQKLLGHKHMQPFTNSGYACHMNIDTTKKYLFWEK